MATQSPDRESESVDVFLRRSENDLRAALRQAEAVGFGDQLRAGVDEAIKQVEYVRRMLA